MGVSHLKDLAYSDRKILLAEMAKICIGLQIFGPVCKRITVDISFDATFVVGLTSGINPKNKTVDTSNSCPNKKAPNFHVSK